jgi:hypothetical protein
LHLAQVAADVLRLAERDRPIGWWPDSVGRTLQTLHELPDLGQSLEETAAASLPWPATSAEAALPADRIARYVGGP